MFDLEIEGTILGECMKNNKSIKKILNIGIEKEDFYAKDNQEIFEAMIKTYEKYGSADITLVARENSSISLFYLAQLIESSLVTNFKAHIKVLVDLSNNRKYLKLAREAQNGKIEDIAESIKGMIDHAETINKRLNSDNTITTLDKVKQVDIYKAEKIKTGFIDIDKKILGFLTGSLTVITGYNGSGKSTIINEMCIAESLSQGYKVFAYSPELTNSNLKSWLYPTLAIEDHFITKDFLGEQYRTIGDIGIKALDNWIKDKLYIYTDDSITNSAKQLLNDMEYMAEYKGVRVFIIDNLMKIDLEGSYKNEFLAQKLFVNNLKEFAKKYNAVVHLVAHPRKKSQGDNSQLSKFDVAGSGDVTNLADYVIAIKRVSDEEKEKAYEKEHIILKDCILKVMKDRPKGSSEFAVQFDFDKERRRFYSSKYELNKDYGYTKNLDMVQVEMKNNIFK